jgi:hypothetical protein
MARQEFTKTAKKAIIDGATNDAGQICCQGCGLVLGFKPYHIDHKHADGLADQKAPKRKLTAADGQLLCLPCHKEKTQADVQLMRKADRMKNFHTGATRPKGKLQGRPFAKSNKGKRLTDPAFLIQ